jgi:hypothetical protein
MDSLRGNGPQVKATVVRLTVFLAGVTWHGGCADGAHIVSQVSRPPAMNIDLDSIKYSVSVNILEVPQPQ